MQIFFVSVTCPTLVLHFINEIDSLPSKATSLKRRNLNPWLAMFLLFSMLLMTILVVGLLIALYPPPPRLIPKDVVQPGSPHGGVSPKGYTST